jgi:hypothetical protein
MTKLKTPARPQGRGVGEGNVPPRYRGGDGEGHEQPFDRFQAARLGLYIFLGAITTMFGALAVLYLLRTPARAEFAFQMPKLAWFSTALILLSSIPCQMALNAARAEQPRGVWRGMLLTLMLGALFLAFQQPLPYTMDAMTPEMVRQFWSLVSEIGRPDWLNQRDDDLVNLLLSACQKKHALSNVDASILNRYISIRLPLIREIVVD